MPHLRPWLPADPQLASPKGSSQLFTPPIASALELSATVCKGHPWQLCLQPLLRVFPAKSAPGGFTCLQKEASCWALRARTELQVKQSVANPASGVALSLLSRRVLPSDVSALLTNAVCRGFNQCTALPSPEMLHCSYTAPCSLAAWSSRDCKPACLQHQEESRTPPWAPLPLAHGFPTPKSSDLEESRSDFLKLLFWSWQCSRGSCSSKGMLLQLSSTICVASFLAAKAVGCATTDFKRRMSGAVGAALSCADFNVLR